MTTPFVDAVAFDYGIVVVDLDDDDWHDVELPRMCKYFEVQDEDGNKDTLWRRDSAGDDKTIYGGVPALFPITATRNAFGDDLTVGQCKRKDVGGDDYELHIVYYF